MSRLAWNVFCDIKIETERKPEMAWVIDLKQFLEMPLNKKEVNYE